MPTHSLITWAVDHPWPTAGITAAALAVVGAALWATIRTVRAITWPPGPVLVAGAGALVCTAYSGDTSWRFAGERLGMVDSTERALMFAAGELALLACAVMARANKAATATDTTAGTAGVPGVLIWVITGVQIIPCYATSGIVGGTVRAVIGPVLAGLLWHIAMGLEIRVARPEALSTGLPAVIGRELRERLLSRLGLATRDRTAEQITRDRATARAVHLAAVLDLHPDGWMAGYRRRRLAAAVARSGAGTSGEQRHRLLQQLAARRTSGQLATVPLASPWAGTPVPADPYPRTPLGVTGAQLRAMDPLAVVHLVRAAHPAVDPAGIAALCTEYGVPVSETQVRVALRAGNPHPAVPAATGAALDPAPEPVPGAGLELDVWSTALVHPEVQSRVPVLAAAGARTPQVHARIPDRPFPESLKFPQSTEPEYGVPAAPDVPEHPVPGPDDVPDEPDDEVPDGDRDVPDPDPLIEQARAEYSTDVPGVRALKTRYGIGQARAQRIRDALGGKK
ncbi:MULTISPECIES: hypothetical protein [unclassified Streptomyces]|uniref:hypothetical protein n=1 Tax=unclassified Streptomyces TaxID=2593676 RepID=UPI00081DA49B|nr:MULTISPECIES: hypothetical protein [unclassified Streptomyces]MYR93081.1 hypothetical protein [Streptomyces sp. SID4937]SCD46124.1 hypothetical protein GA0115243_102161 [Streptomyces sp. ScaeMP-e83]